MKCYYHLDLNENGDFEFEQFEISTCNSQIWYFRDACCANPAHPTPDEIKFIDALFLHSVSIATVWAEFAEARFQYYLK